MRIRWLRKTLNTPRITSTREDARHVELKIRFQDQVAKAGFRTDELADDRSQDCEHDRDIQPGENKR